MSRTREHFLKTQRAAELKELWQNAAVKAPARTSAGKLPALGVNFRVDLLKALKATWETASVTMKIIVAVKAPIDPLSWLGIGVEAVSAVRSVVSSLVQQMQPIDYVSYVILAQTPGGIEQADLKKQVEAFLKGRSSTKFAWYLGMNEGRVKQAREAIKSSDWFDEVMGRLAKSNMMVRKGNRVSFQPRHFTIGWESE